MYELNLRIFQSHNGQSEYVQSTLSFIFIFRSVSMGDMLNEEEVEHLPPLSQSRYERMHEQYNSFLEEEDHWQDVREYLNLK